MKKNLDIQTEPWVRITYTQHKRGKYYEDRKEEFFYEIPRYMIERWRWLINWRWARLICDNPFVDHEIAWSFYDKKSGLDMSIGSLLSSVSSCKGQITKLNNAIAQYLEQKKGELFFDKDHDELYQKALAKLKRQEEKLEHLLIEVENQSSPSQAL